MIVAWIQKTAACFARVSPITSIKSGFRKDVVSKSQVSSVFPYHCVIWACCISSGCQTTHLMMESESPESKSPKPQTAVLNEDQILDQPVHSSTSCGDSESSQKLKRKSSADTPGKTKKAKLFRPGYGEEKYDETEYYFENGLRKVYPYHYTYTTFAKGRWIGKLLVDVFADEFRAHEREVYVQHILRGLVTVNSQPIGLDYVMKDNDLIFNKVHRHEIPVLATPLKIVHRSEDMLVIDKPPSIPVHPCGRYRHNSVAFILAKEYDLKDICVVHRLDRMTSGLLMFGLTSQKAHEMVSQIRDHKVTKEYVCRVDGNFPDEHVICQEPIRSLTPQIGICIVHPRGKACKTEFTKLSSNGKTSVVLCKPLTGRMHQIRVHLQYLGYPIVNDVLYNHEVFGPLKGKGGEFGKTHKQLAEDLAKVHTAENWLGVKDKDAVGAVSSCLSDGENGALESTSCLKMAADEGHSDNPLPPTMFLSSLKHYADKEELKAIEIKYKFNQEKVSFDENCDQCNMGYKEPQLKDLIMFLHALRYKGEGWEYETQMPEWAKPTWTGN